VPSPALVRGRLPGVAWSKEDVAWTTSDRLDAVEAV
jgi:hypothetical protein